MKHPSQERPPVVLQALLGWLLRDAWETPLGDFEEYYHQLVDARGVRSARWWYLGQVVRLVPDRLYEKLYENTFMLKSYLLLAYRNLLKNRTASVINIAGLSVAIGCTLVVYVLAHSALTSNASHEHADRIFLVEHVRSHDGAVQTWGTTPAPLGPAMEAEIPQVKRAVRIAEARGTLRYADRSFEEGLRFVDDGFLDMFTYPLKYGTSEALREPDALVLSARTATRYFGSENPVGLSVTVRVGDAPPASFTVRGVADVFPANDGIGFDVLLPYAARPGTGADGAADWAALTRATFVQVDRPETIGTVARQMDRFRARYDAAVGAPTPSAFVFDNLLDLSRHADEVQDPMAEPIPWAALAIFFCVAAFLLLLACINYVNIALSTASRRFKEIGIRKAVGSNRHQLIAQFMGENVLLCLISLVLGVAVARLFLVPEFSRLTGLALELPLDGSLDLWLFLVGVLVVLTIASGFYPAFYIASFQPAAIFRGHQPVAGRRRFMHVFLTLQFVLAFITTISCVALLLNARYQAHRDWGYDQENVLVVRLEDGSQFDVLGNAARQRPDVLGVAGSRQHIGAGDGTYPVEVDGESEEAVLFDVGPGYIETMGLRLRAGLGWGDTERTDAVVVNEAFAAAYGWAEAVGKTLRIDETAYEVIGVVDDFHYDSFFEDIDPVVLRLGDPAHYRFLAVRVQEGRGALVMASLRAAWKRVAPESPFRSFFQNEVFDSFFQTNRGLTDVFLFIAAIALIIACMGLFGLASQHLMKRMKEIGVRKVLGASNPHIVRVVNRRFIVLLGVAALVATPLSYVLLVGLLDSVYTYHMPVGPTAFFIAYGLIFLTGLLTLSTQLYRLMTTSPVETLRSE